MMKKLLIIVLFYSATTSAAWRASTSMNGVIVNRPGVLGVKISSAPNQTTSLDLTKHATSAGANPDAGSMVKKASNNQHELSETQQSSVTWFQWLKGLGANANRAVGDFVGRNPEHPRVYALDADCLAHIISQAEGAQTPTELLAIVKCDDGNGIHKVIKHFRAAIRENGNDLNAAIYYANGNATVEGLQEHLKKLNQFEEPLAKYYQAQIVLSRATRHILTKLLEQKTHEARQVVADNQSSFNNIEIKYKKKPLVLKIRE